MTPVLTHLRWLIAQQGPVSVASYMQLALGHPIHGYYTRADPLGAAGDFITSPEISQMFGELLGLWCVQSWRDMGSPAVFALTELGPGRGTLMADALRAAKHVPDFLAAAQLHLVETSPVLRAKQLDAIGPRAQWHQSVDALPGLPTLIIANEFFDALPVRQFLRTGRGWYERMVGIDPDTDELLFCLSPEPLVDISFLPGTARDAAQGAIMEVCPAAVAIAGELARRMAADGGAALIIDYGHGASAPGETLQAMRAHKFCDVLADPGFADLTAHVDFAQLAGAARAAGARIYGPVAQGVFLNRLGIQQRAEMLLRNADAGQAEQIRTAVTRLTAPDQMGDLFKVMAVCHASLATPAGFEN